MNERLKELRKYLRLSQEEFGSKIGVTKSSISRLEAGANNFTDQMIKSICREFNADYTWFTSGEGDMFYQVTDGNPLINELALEYGLDKNDITLIEEYIKLDANSRASFVNFIKNVFK